MSIALDLDPASGCWTDGAASFIAADAEFLIAPNTSGLQTGDVDFWMGAWINPDSTPPDGEGYVIIGKDEDGTDTRDYTLDYDNTNAPSLRFYVNGGGDSAKQTQVSQVIPLNEWHMVFAYYQASGNTLAISYDDGDFSNNSVASPTPNISTTPFTVGARLFTGFEDYWDGRIDSVAFGKEPSATFTEIRDTLWNGGSGLTYQSLSTQDKTDFGLISFWNLDETSGIRFDSHSDNDLAPSGAVGVGEGIAKRPAETGDTVSQLLPFLQGDPTLRPILGTAASGFPILEFSQGAWISGVVPTTTEPFTVASIFSLAPLASGDAILYEGESHTFFGDTVSVSLSGVDLGPTVPLSGMGTEPDFVLAIAQWSGASTQLSVGGNSWFVGDPQADASLSHLVIGGGAPFEMARLILYADEPDANAIGSGLATTYSLSWFAIETQTEPPASGEILPSGTPALPTDLRVAIRQQLTGSPSIDAQQVYVGWIPPKADLPAISISCVSNIPFITLGGPLESTVARLQIDSWANDPGSAFGLSRATYDQLQSLVGAVSGLTINKCNLVNQTDHIESPKDASSNFVYRIRSDYSIQYQWALPSGTQ